MSKAFFSWAKAHGVKRFFFAGSQAEMGRGTREEPLPASPYGEKKLAFSEYGLKTMGIWNLSTFEFIPSTEKGIMKEVL